jgi:glycosyltransferase involved in cell wall biosynthesis
MNQRLKPKVSIVMPYKNSSLYISTAIKSILIQDYENWELIAINDNSEDNSREIVESFTDKRIISLELENTYGISSALNLGLDRSKGVYVARFDSDDINLRNRISSQVYILENNKNTGLLAGRAIAFDHNQCYAIGKSYSGIDVNRHLLVRNFIIHPTVMIRKSIIDEYNLRYNTHYSNSEDYELWMKISEVTSITNSENFFIYYRIHDQSQTHKDRLNQLKLSLKVQRKYIVKKLLSKNFYEITPTVSLSYLLRLMYFHSFKSSALRKFIDILRKTGTG